MRVIICAAHIRRSGDGTRRRSIAEIVYMGKMDKKQRHEDEKIIYDQKHYGLNWYLKRKEKLCE